MLFFVLLYLILDNRCEWVYKEILNLKRCDLGSVCAGHRQSKLIWGSLVWLNCWCKQKPDGIWHLKWCHIHGISAPILVDRFLALNHFLLLISRTVQRFTSHDRMVEMQEQNRISPKPVGPIASVNLPFYWRMTITTMCNCLFGCNVELMTQSIKSTM